MYKKSFELLIELHVVVLLVMSFDLAFYIVADLGFASGLAFAFSGLLWIALFIAAFYKILSPMDNDPAPNYDGDLTGLFLWCGGFYFAGIGFLFVSLLAIQIPMKHFGLFESVSTEQMTNILLIVMSEFWFVVVALLIGTMLPAFIGGYGKGFIAALRRSKSVFSYVLGCLLIGPVALTGVYSFSLLLLENAGIVATDLFGGSGAPNFSMFIALVIGYLFDGLAIVMTAWILSDAYLRAEKLQEYAEVRI